MRSKILCYEGTLTGCNEEDTFLRREDCEIRTFQNGPAILDAIDAFKPALVVMEESMPGLGGQDAASVVLENPSMRGTRVLLIFEDENEMKGCRLTESQRLVFAYRPLDTLLMLGKVSKLLKVPTRIHIRAKIIFEVKGRTAENQLFYGKMLDISTGGFLFALDRPLKLGDVLYCFFSLSRNEQLVFASGRIVRFAGTPGTSNYLYGVEFVNLRSDDRRRIAEFIFRHGEADTEAPNIEEMTDRNVTFV